MVHAPKGSPKCFFLLLKSNKWRNFKLPIRSRIEIVRRLLVEFIHFYLNRLQELPIKTHISTLIPMLIPSSWSNSTNDFPLESFWYKVSSYSMTPPKQCDKSLPALNKSSLYVRRFSSWMKVDYSQNTTYSAQIGSKPRMLITNFTTEMVFYFTTKMIFWKLSKYCRGSMHGNCLLTNVTE